VRLSRQKLAPLAIGMAQADRGLPGVRANAEHVELKLEIDGRSVIARRHGSLHTKASLLDAQTRLPVRPELTLRRRNLRGAEGVLPAGVDTLGVLDPIRHGETVNLERALFSAHWPRHQRTAQPNSYRGQRQGVPRVAQFHF